MKKKWILVLALIITLLGSGLTYAFTYTTASATITGTADSEYATVTVDDSPPSFAANIFGKHRGDVPSGDMFIITPDTTYTGDMLIKVYLTNADELSKTYQHLNMKVEIWDSEATTPVNIFAGETGHTFQLLTLDNGVVTFPLEMDDGTSPFKVKIAGGSYGTNPRSPVDWESGYSVSPLLFCEVTQK